MKYPVRLFLGNDEVEFSTPPEILFNYSVTELTNPTIVKNSYSKTITIEGTPQNNRIFGHIYNMERLQNYNGTTTGSDFNPLIKTDFTLYYNGSIYESGYFKLDEVRRNDNNIEYDITLYGGLGNFFYNLSFREDGNPMELSDLTYWYEKWSGKNLGFNITKETIRDAWSAATHYTPATMYNTINFAPCYNGIPENLSADKVLINNSGTTDFRSSSTSFPSYQRYSMGTTNEELTEWEAFDLRSYLQRPVIKVAEIIDACCDPTNNGGYTVYLDQSFFNIENPYYYNAWMTLPLLTELDVPETVSTPLTISAITKQEDFLYNLNSGAMGNTTNVSFDMGLKFTPSDGYSGDSVYLLRDYTANGGTTLQSRFVKSFQFESFYMIQMLGYNATGQIAAVSEMYRIITPPDGDYVVKEATWQKDEFEEYSPETTVNDVKTIAGKFTKVNGEYIFTDMDGNEQILHFSFPSDAQFSSLKLKIVPYYTESMRRTWQGGSSSLKGATYVKFWDTIHTHSNTWQDEHYVPNLNKVLGTVSYIPKGATGTTETFDGFYTGRYYSKKDLLTLGVTPAQFLLSYAKIFGLYFVKDVESNTINILTRHDFYQRDVKVNINDLVDKGSDIKITPASPKYQYYDFSLDQVESEAGKQYRDTYGNDYGAAIVNTNYQYEKEHKKVLDGNIFKSAVNVLEKDKYYLKPYFYTSGINVWHGGPTYINNVFSYWYYNSASIDSSQEHTRDSNVMTGQTLNPDGLRYYDLFPKPQFHDVQNKATDGSMVLLFQTDKIDMAGIGYHLTDDTERMYTLNGGKPCWILTNGTTDGDGNVIALDVELVPVFSRDIYRGNYITASWDMGSPLATYVPNKFVSSWQSIFSKGWKSYITDLYNVNTRILKCRCLLRERPNPEWLRRFYWFDNSYWRLNEIKDWNISSFDTTEMEFIKVQDISDYDNVPFTNRAVIEWNLDTYSIGQNGGTITGHILVSDGSYIYTDDEYYPISVQYSGGSTGTLGEYSDYIDPTAAQGVTKVPVTLTIPANTSEESRTITFRVVEGAMPDEKVYPVTITQAGAEIERKNYLAMDIVSGGTIAWKKVGTEASKVIEYSKDEGENWSSITSNSGSVINVSAGDRVVFRGNNVRYGSPTNNGTTFSGGTAYFNLSGNIMSLIYGDDFEGQTTLVSANTFQFLFKNTNVISASGLTLPATTLAEDCYRSLFLNCTSLVDFPNLPATTLTPYCYHSMFYGCTSLTSAPILHSTSLARNCYCAMFQDCTSLTTAPALPATTLAQYCYSEMFQGCTSLITAPVLSAATLVERCYQIMFSGCSSLNYVRCLATDISANNCTTNWLSGVAATGTFVKANETTWNRGTNGIPTGWTVVDSGDTPIFNCYLDFSYGDVTAPQTATWDEYDIYYNTTGGNPIEDGSLMMSISCGTILYQGNTWNPTSSSYYSVSSPFGDTGSVSQIEVPQSLAGQTIYLKVEFGSAEAGQAIYSSVVMVQIPSSGGTVNVTIPQF